MSYQAPSQRVNQLMQDGANFTEVYDEITVACTDYTANFLGLLRDGHWTLQHAHDVLKNTWHIDDLDLMQISGLARAMQIYQSSEAAS